MRIFKDIWTYFGQSQSVFIRMLHIMVICLVVSHLMIPGSLIRTGALREMHLAKGLIPWALHVYLPLPASVRLDFARRPYIMAPNVCSLQLTTHFNPSR